MDHAADSILLFYGLSRLLVAQIASPRASPDSGDTGTEMTPGGAKAQGIGYS
jgi:hypothetical protein